MNSKYDCVLFNCKSENKLSNYLLINKNAYNKLKNDFNKNSMDYYQSWKDKKGRELFSGNTEIRKIHKRLVTLFDIKKTDYLKSGTKKQSSITNAKEHEENNFFLFLDIQSFYPSITDKLIKKRLILDYKQSGSVASFISNIVTVPQEKINFDKALVTGSPLSQHFIYVINKKMFDELEELAKKEKMTFTVYVDDIAFSSKIIISHSFFNKVFNIIKKYQFNIHKNKTFRGTFSSKSHITGIQITKNGFRLMDKHKEKILTLVCKILKHNLEKDKKSLIGILNYALQVNKGYSKYRYIVEKYLLQ